MKFSHLINRLSENGFKTYDLPLTLAERFNEHDLHAWTNGNRIVVAKPYFNEYSFVGRWKDDQIAISYLHEALENAFKSNLYFLIVLDFDWTIFKNVEATVNQVEKDYYVCRKYVLSSQEDVLRVPFVGVSGQDIGKSSDSNLSFVQELVAFADKNLRSPTVEKLIELYFNMRDPDAADIDDVLKEGEQE